MAVFPSLPQDMITDILSRLPVKSLIRFQSASEHRLSLITNPKFITAHLNHSTKNPSLLFTESDKFSDRISLLRHVETLTVDPVRIPRSMKDSAAFKKIYLTNPYKRLRIVIDIVGSCGGLLCINYFAAKTCSIYVLRRITRFKDSLALFKFPRNSFFHFEPNCSCDSWVMHANGGGGYRENWTKLFTIQPVSVDYEGVAIWRDKIIMKTCDSLFLLYDPISHEIFNIPIEFVYNFPNYSLCEYVESLAPVDGTNNLVAEDVPMFMQRLETVAKDLKTVALDLMQRFPSCYTRRALQ